MRSELPVASSGRGETYQRDWRGGFTLVDVCERVLWLDHGRLVAYGPAQAVIEAYLEHVRRHCGR